MAAQTHSEDNATPVRRSAASPSASPSSQNDFGRFCLLVPFDVGTTYVFEAANPNSPRTEWEEFVKRFAAQTGGDVPSLEDAIQSGKSQPRLSGTWEFEPLPAARFHSPFGYSITFKFPSSQLSEPLSPLCFMEPGPWARATIFPMGIGVLQVSAMLKEEPSKAYRCMVRNRPEVKRALRVSLRRIATHFTASMEMSLRVAKTKNVRILEETMRTVQLAEFGYSVLFARGAFEMPELSECPGKFKYKTPEGSWADINIYWADAIAVSSDEKLVDAIENDFFVATTCWYALNVMNRITTRKVNELMFGPKGRHRAELGRQSRMLGISYLEAGSLSTPIHWAREDNDLRLLQAIHRRWSSDGWWTQVKERTTMLTAYHEKLDDEATGIHERRIAALGALIAAFVVPSAIKDLDELERSLGHPSLPLLFVHAHAQWLAVGTPIAIVLLLLGYLVSARKR